MPRAHWRLRVGAALLLLAPLQFWVFEAVSAGAWTSPRYGYAANFISDLGVYEAQVVFEGRLVDSPLAALMNGSFVLLGVLVLAAALLLAPFVPESRRRNLLRGLAATFAVGATLVAAFPENGVLVAHAIGALLNIGIGNVLAVLVGRWGSRMGLPPWLSTSSIALGVIGLAALTALVTVPALYSGLTERFAAYPFMISQAAIGLLILLTAGPRTPLATNHR